MENIIALISQNNEDVGLEYISSMTCQNKSQGTHKITKKPKTRIIQIYSFTISSSADCGKGEL